MMDTGAKHPDRIGWTYLCCQNGINPESTELVNLNIQPLQVVSRYRDPQFQVAENYLDL